MNVPENMVPLVYVIAAAACAAGLQYASVPEVTIGLIIGAAMTRVKRSDSDKDKS
jgi:hypothetical protein